MLLERMAVRLRKWTRSEYYRLADLGIFRPDERLELVGGEIYAMTPQKTRHATAIRAMELAARAAFGEGYVVSVQLPLYIDEDSEPEPDVAVAAGRIEDFKAEHPRTAVLVVEVALSSLDHDQEVKGSLYASARIPDYWILNLDEDVVEVFREPVADPAAEFGWRYASRQVFHRGESVAPLARPDSPIEVDSLLL